MQLAELSRLISQVDGREADHFITIRARLREMGAQLATITEVAEVVAVVSQTVTGIEGRIEALEDPGPQGKGYVPIPAPRWFELQGAERAEAVDRLQSWVETVFRPGMGKSASQLPPCWAEHEFCLYQLDVLSELWSVLWLQPRRNAPQLGGQAEWLTRLLPAIADLMTRETAGCEHTRATSRAAR
jgi:hypothetical protein